MVKRTGTYVAFDGQGEVNPTKSDRPYYSLMQAWDANGDIEFHFVNSHDKTFAVCDDSKKETLKARIRQRLSMSKNMVVILTADTRERGSMLSYEIEMAVDYYGLPLIIVYPDYKYIRNVDSHADVWPKVLADRIKAGAAHAIHVPFKKDVILDAISQFSVNDDPLDGAKNVYSEKAYRNWGLM